MARAPHRSPASLRMARPSGIRERLVAAFMMGLALFNPPLLAVFNAPTMLWGIPLLFVYVFLAWLGLILALALIIERSAETEGDNRAATEGEGGDAP
ncbi:hypothetical protein [Telmatospirillum sp. J64-1]|uniref:hypothetical protein n=1 Tax=Telmatospirillum sp. J64-1 TaxID=2502183 RepID=UPI001C8F2234|nr:hypothetical protein [Telmatospirillum sp. J64-1]